MSSLTLRLDEIVVAKFRPCLRYCYPAKYKGLDLFVCNNTKGQTMFCLDKGNNETVTKNQKAVFVIKARIKKLLIFECSFNLINYY